MFDKKKLNFWRLAFIFTGFTLLVLVYLWNSPQEPKSKMMGESMGNMMKQMHVTNMTIYDLLTSEREKQASMSEMHSHHQNQSPIIFKLNFLTTSIIFLLLPFIIGGAIILAIVWIKIV